MKILIVNPIIYTSETKEIKKVNTIKDTMIYDLCLGFKAQGHEVVLAAAEDYKPTKNENYPFEIIWLKAKIKRIFPANVIPFCPDIKKYVLQSRFDLIITSEVFSLNSLMLSIKTKKNLVVWHELAKHNRLLHEIPSRLWYNIIARIFFKNTKIVPRSLEAKDFISRFCNNVSETVVDHGVNLDKFTYQTKKENYFAVSSQLIKRKRIDKIINAFGEYVKRFDSSCHLYIMGEGELKKELEEQVKDFNLEKNITFTGKLLHSDLIEILKKARALLVYTEKDNNMVSVVESIAVATPVITTSVPYNAGYIKENSLGIVNDNWDENDLLKISNDKSYVESCLNYRQSLSTTSRADTFIKISKTL